MKTQFGTPVLWGSDPRWINMEITNLPEDTISVRRRFRNIDPALAFVKTKRGIEKWILAPDGADKLKLQILHGANQKQ
jgi:hypothetical protein